MPEKKNAINEYVCPKCRKRIRTINRDEGTTPFMLLCKATEGCGGLSQSNFYRSTMNESPKWEWIRPTPDEMETYISDNKSEQYRDAIQDHVNHGGVVLRKMA